MIYSILNGNLCEERKDMKAYMSSKICDYNQFVEFYHQEHRPKPMEIQIIDTKNLEDNELNIFLRDFKRDQKWLFPYLCQMSIVKNGTWNCIVVKAEQLIAPIIVYSNMCMYPQYIGILQ